MSKPPVGILLAAGQSKRFGSNKLLHSVYDGIPMLIASAQTLVRALPDSIVVINQSMATCTTQLEALGLKVVLNENSESGIGSSISCGIRASDNASGWLVFLADMPYIKSETISLLVKKMGDGEKIVAPVFNKQRGHPVGFSRCYLNELIALNEDIGARNIINKYQDNIELVSVNDEGVVKDIDYANEIVI